LGAEGLGTAWGKTGVLRASGSAVRLAASTVRMAVALILDFDLLQRVRGFPKMNTPVQRGGEALVKRETKGLLFVSP
jgi:hypothetical protein